jgi:hypothetical protein
MLKKWPGILVGAWKYSKMKKTKLNRKRKEEKQQARSKSEGSPEGTLMNQSKNQKYL